MDTLARSLHETSPPLIWFGEFLREELAPYPGRTATVLRMTIAATLVMIACMTFRIPFGFIGATYALLITRESRRATLQSAGIMLLVTGIGAGYVLISAWFVISVPFLHFLWIICSFFLAFLALSVIANYGAASIFAIVISAGVPLWDRHLSAETNVEDTLWLTLAASVGIAVTAAVELAFLRIKPGDDVLQPVGERLAAVENFLVCYTQGRLDSGTEKKVIRLSMLGTSALRRLLRRSGYSPHYRAQMGGLVDVVGRLVDIAAALTELRFEPSGADRKHFQNLAQIVATIRIDLLNRQIPAPIQFNPDDEPSHGSPLLREMEKIVSLIPQTFVGSRAIDEGRNSTEDTPGSYLVSKDALLDPEHLQFALKGCFAASACYIVYSSIDWQGINTAVNTCLLTALSTVGASRQKQFLRFAGAMMGGFVIGMGSQMFILPHLDSIAGFTVLFTSVTFLASWFMTSTPRLSYFGLQVALAFYLINLQEFAVQTSLRIARDRVVGVMLGLFVMWLVFDQLWGAPAAAEMKKTFISNLRLLARFAGEPPSSDLRVAIERGYALREKLTKSFDSVRAFADAVLFEFGPSRRGDLRWRTRILRWQPQLRAIFLTRIALWKYRTQRPGFELPEAVLSAEKEFDDQSAIMLNGVADRIEGKASFKESVLQASFEHLEEVSRTCCPGAREVFTPQLEAFLILSRRMQSLGSWLDQETRFL